MARGKAAPSGIRVSGADSSRVSSSFQPPQAQTGRQLVLAGLQVRRIRLVEVSSSGSVVPSAPVASALAPADDPAPADSGSGSGAFSSAGGSAP